MKNIAFNKYIDGINTIIKDARTRHDLASIALHRAIERHESVQKSGASPAKMAVAAAQVREAKEQYWTDVKDILSDTDEKFSNLRKELSETATRYFSADPESVDHDAVALLNSGVMSETDLAVLAKKFWGNATMLKLISGKAQDLNTRTAAVLCDKIDNYMSVKNRLSVFDDAVSIAKRTIQADENMAGVFQTEWDNRFYESLRNNMAEFDNFPLEV